MTEIKLTCRRCDKCVVVSNYREDIAVNCPDCGAEMRGRSPTPRKSKTEKNRRGHMVVAVLAAVFGLLLGQEYISILQEIANKDELKPVPLKLPGTDGMSQSEKEPVLTVVEPIDKTQFERPLVTAPHEPPPDVGPRKQVEPALVIKGVVAGQTEPATAPVVEQPKPLAISPTADITPTAMQQYAKAKANGPFAFRAWCATYLQTIPDPDKARYQIELAQMLMASANGAAKDRTAAKSALKAIEYARTKNFHLHHQHDSQDAYALASTASNERAEAEGIAREVIGICAAIRSRGVLADGMDTLEAQANKVLSVLK